MARMMYDRMSKVTVTNISSNPKVSSSLGGKVGLEELEECSRWWLLLVSTRASAVDIASSSSSGRNRWRIARIQPIVGDALVKGLFSAGVVVFVSFGTLHRVVMQRQSSCGGNCVGTTLRYPFASPQKGVSVVSC